MTFVFDDSQVHIVLCRPMTMKKAFGRSPKSENARKARIIGLIKSIGRKVECKYPVVEWRPEIPFKFFIVLEKRKGKEKKTTVKSRNQSSIEMSIMLNRMIEEYLLSPCLLGMISSSLIMPRTSDREHVKHVYAIRLACRRLA